MLLPVLALAGLLLAPRVRSARMLLMFAGVVYAGWCATSIVMRFAIVLLVALLPFAAAILQWALDLFPLRARLTHALAALLFAIAAAPPMLSAVRDQLARYGADTPFVGGIPSEQMLASRINLAAAGTAMSRTLSSDARILLIGDARLALVPRRTVLSTAIDRPAVTRFLSESSGAADLARRLAQEFTHVLVNHRELKRWSDQYAFQARLEPGGSELLQECLRSNLISAGSWGDVQLYEVPGAGKTPSARP